MIRGFFFMYASLSCLPHLHSATNTNSSMSICQESFTCPGLAPFKYPFFNVTDTRCGLIKVNCTSKGGELQIGGRSYEIVGKHDEHGLIIHNITFDNLVKKNSCKALMNTFTFPSLTPLLYSVSIFSQHQYKSYNKCIDYTFYYNYLDGTLPSELPHTCQIVQLPVKWPGHGLDETNIFSLLSSNTTISFQLSPSCEDCYKNGSRCDTENGQDVQCSYDINDGERKLPRLIPVLVLGVGCVTILIIIILCLKRKGGRGKKAKCNVKVEMFIKNHEFLAPKRYSYSQVEKMTNSFNAKLGQGGFGAVYKGVLKNQSLVAVKVLSEVKGDGEDFINEVASVGRTSHVNIVSLVGFCLEGRQRALIYEFMPNGSLERFIYGRGSLNSSQLEWERLHEIAIGIARGLEYLHRGCSTRILHFDIKPHNILLDKDFCPKISDFGLAKLLREKESKISSPI